MKKIVSIVALVSSFALALEPAPAKACGCVSPPAIGDDFAINQQGEHIIFEVNEEKEQVTAHVFIKYVGEPENFAWILPIPNVVELDVTEPEVFAFLSRQTSTQVNSVESNLCPSPEYICEYDDGWSTGAEDDGAEGGAQFTSSDVSQSPSDPDGVEVELETTVGDYDVVVFKADEGDKAVEWLQANDFIVNDTMSPYMQPYLDAGMMFLAAKLVAGAGVDSIKPLKMTYAGKHPMIPLQLTAVAAEPHMPVVAYIYADKPYRPVDQPLLQLDEKLLTGGESSNFPVALNRAIDEAGRDAFLIEYSSVAPPFEVSDDPSGCCSDPNEDICGIGDDGVCQCPTRLFDQSDCEEFPELVAGARHMNVLAAAHPFLTRLITTLSPEEMNFDPMFEPDDRELSFSRLELNATAYSLEYCSDDVIDKNAYTKITETQDCSSIYCGSGSCALDVNGQAGCLCDAEFVARSFTRLDGVISVTCVPEVGTVDLGAEHDLPNACEGISCGEGECVDIGGFPSCRCQPDQTAVLIRDDELPRVECVRAEVITEDSGGNNPGLALKELKVCAPKPEDCGDHGHLVKNENIIIQGEICEDSLPDPDDLDPSTEPPSDPSTEPSDDPSDESKDATDESRDTAGAAEQSSDAIRDDGCNCRSNQKLPPLLPLGIFASIFIWMNRRRS